MARVERPDSATLSGAALRRARLPLAIFIAAVYLHNAVPHLTMMPRVNVDEPWLMERAWQVMQTGQPRQPMYGLDRPYLLQPGYPYLLAAWMTPFGVGLLQARALSVVLGLGALIAVAILGRRLIDPLAGLSAALFLAVDSNFLGSARNARTDMPAVCFAACALACYATGRHRPRPVWWGLSGIFAGLAMLCHGNAFWIGAILALWLAIDLGRRLFIDRRTYWVGSAAALTLAPYLGVILVNRAEVQRQVNAFVPERVPFLSPARVLREVALEAERYRSWYFGLVTNSVPNPLLWAFELSLVAGVAVLVWRIVSGRATSGERLVAALAAGTVVIFAAFINNKVPVYMPHLLIGFSLVGGLAIVTITGARAASAVAVVGIFVAGYGTAAVAYYEKWYSSVRKSELVPYERTSATMRALVPAGPRLLYGSPHFWLPFHADADTRFTSYALGAGAVRYERPAYLLVDESQWLPAMTTAANAAARRAWVDLIERDCALDAMALGTAYGTVGAFRCDGAQRPHVDTPRIVGDGSSYRIGELVSDLGAADLLGWKRYDDPRRRATDSPVVALSASGLRISGTGWPGIVTDYPATPGAAYLVRVAVTGARDGDLLYLGTWKAPQVLSLGLASSAGIPAPLAHEPWFPGDRAFIATASRVQILIYSEAPQTDFTVSSVRIYRLTPS